MSRAELELGYLYVGSADTGSGMAVALVGVERPTAMEAALADQSNAQRVLG